MNTNADLEESVTKWLSEMDDDQYFYTIDLLKPYSVGGFGILDKSVVFSSDTNYPSNWGGFEYLDKGNETLQAETWMNEDTLKVLLKGKNDFYIFHELFENYVNVEVRMNKYSEAVKCKLKKFHRNYVTYEQGDTLLAHFKIVTDFYFDESIFDSSELIEKKMDMEYFVKSTVK